MNSDLEMSSGFRYWGAWLRLRFARLSTREQVLSLLFAGALLGTWMVFQAGRHAAVQRERRIASTEAKNQEQLIGEKEVVEALYTHLMQSVNLEALPSAGEANAQIDSLLRKYGFADFKINNLKSAPGIPLTFHSFSVDLSKADYKRLINFTNELKASLPYVSIRQVAVQAQRRTPEFLDVKLELKSIEYTQ